MDNFSQELIERRGALTQTEAGRLLGVSGGAVGCFERHPPRTHRARLRLLKRYDAAGLVAKN